MLKFMVFGFDARNPHTTLSYEMNSLTSKDAVSKLQKNNPYFVLQCAYPTYPESDWEDVREEFIKSQEQ